MRIRVAHVVAVVALSTGGCVMLSGAGDLGIASTGDVSGGDGGGDGSSPSPERDGSVSGDSGRDAREDASSTDSGPDAPLKTVRCNGVECAERCCILTEGPAACAAPGVPCPLETVERSCDERADCPSGQSCCLSVIGGAPRSACAPACNGGSALTLCGSDAECSGIPCTPLEQFGPPFSSMHGRGGCQ